MELSSQRLKQALRAGFRNRKIREASRQCACFFCNNIAMHRYRFGVNR